MPTSEEDFDTC